MKNLTIGIALATLIGSPVFVTPLDAVTAGAALYAAMGMAGGITGMLRSATNSLSQTEQPSRSRGAGAAVSVDRRAQTRRSVWRWARPSSATVSTRRTVGAWRLIDCGLSPLHCFFDEVRYLASQAPPLTATR